jgi:radical SAM protein with 4Fe4S-binding SPASM domain
MIMQSKSYPIQRFPGEKVPPLPEWDAFPHPSLVGKYVSKSSFLKLPKWQAQWVHWDERVKLVLEGRYHEIFPLDFEGDFTYRCNFMCPHCSQRPAREKWSKTSSWKPNTEITPWNTMDIDDLKLTLNQISSNRMDNYVGILWGGGDPTTIPWIYDALRYSNSLNIHNEFITNGASIDIEELIKIAPDILRVSLNCGTKKIHSQFHGYSHKLPYFDKILMNIKDFARAKRESRCKTLLGISIIIDERNLIDSVRAAETIQDIAIQIGQEPNDETLGIDYIIVRPVMNYPHLNKNHIKLNETTKKAAYNEVEKMRKILGSVNIPVIPVKDSFEDYMPGNYPTYTRCLSYSWFGQILPTGDIQLCSDTYSNSNYTIGNILTDSFSNIWTSRRRKLVSEKANSKQCFLNYCPHNSKGHHLNTIFLQIERLKDNGNKNLIEQWIQDLRQVTYPLPHSFFM